MKIVVYQLCLVATVLVLVGCQGFSSHDYLDGKFIDFDTEPVDLHAPSNNSVVSANPKLSWSKRNGSSKYLLEISGKPDFSNLLLAKKTPSTTYELNNDDLIGIGALDTASYYWRITAEYVTGIQIVSRPFVFHVLKGTVIYVNLNTTGSQIGNKTYPYKSIQAAIERANELRDGITTLAYDVYVAQGTYIEELNMRPGISIYGGYEPVNWNRNIASNVTTINATTDTTIRVGPTITATHTATTRIEGFSITGSSNSGSNYGISNLSGNPTISNNIINISNGFGYGIDNDESSNPVISNNTINGTVLGIRNQNNSSPVISGNSITGGNYGIENGSGSSPTITGNTIVAGTTGIRILGGSPQILDNSVTATNGGILSNRTGIDINSSSPTISRNVIIGGNGTSINYGINIVGSAAPTITNNLILGGSGSGSNRGIQYATSGTPGAALIANNTINGGTVDPATGILLNASAVSTNLTIRNNIIFNSTNINSYCIFENTANADPTLFQNNNLFGCPSALYRDHDTATSVNNLTTSITLPTGTLGSMGNISINNTGNQLFMNINGPDGNILTFSDNDWRLTTSAAICEVRGGGQDLSTSFVTDKNGVTRTIMALAGCTPANFGAANWSMGAYESN